MEIKKIDEKMIQELHNYQKVDICHIEGLNYPVMLRQNTLDAFVADEIFRREG